MTIKKESSTLYALRGIAALLVLSVHMLVFVLSKKEGFPNINPSWFSHGVPIFYILTGYFSYLSILRAKSFSIKRYIGHRAAVLLPPYYLVLVLVVVLMKPFFITTEKGLYIFLTHIFGIQSFFEGYGGAINGTLWMLSYSFLFYILIACLSSFIATPKKGLTFALILILLSFIWRIYVFYGHAYTDRVFLGLGFFTPLGFIGFGLILASIRSLKIESSLSRLIFNPYACLVIIPFIFFMLLWIQKELQITVVYWRNPISVIFYPLLQASCWSILIYYAIRYCFNPKLEMIAKYSGLEFIGRCSYSLYLVHIPVIIALTKYYKLGGRVSNEFVVLLAVALATLVIHYFVFLPAKNKKLIS